MDSALGVGAGAALLWWMRDRGIGRTTLTYDKGSSVARRIVAGCPSLRRYSPTPYLVTGLAQTIATAACDAAHTRTAAAAAAGFRRMTLALPELVKPPGATCCPPVVPAGEVSWDMLEPATTAAGAGAGAGGGGDATPIVILVPGLTGSSESGYIRRCAWALTRARRFPVRVAVYNPRARGGNAMRSPFTYSAGYTEDLRRAVAALRAAHPAAPLLAVSYSLGSNVLAKYLGEEGARGRAPLAGAVCLATPIDLLGNSVHLEGSLEGRLMDTLLVGFCCSMIRAEERVLRDAPGVDLARVYASRTMTEFDDRAVAPMMGYQCASDYYRGASSGPWLSSIRVPTLFVHAANDPITAISNVRHDNFNGANPFLVSCVTAEGGHSMDWPTGWGLESWSARVAAEFIEAHARFSNPSVHGFVGDGGGGTQTTPRSRL